MEMSHLGDSGTPCRVGQLNITQKRCSTGLTPDEDDLADGRRSLKEGKSSPRPVTANKLEAIADYGTHYW